MVLFLFLLTFGLTSSRGAPSAPATPGGYWEQPFNHGLSGTANYEAIHMALIPASGDSNGLTGKVLVWGFTNNQPNQQWYTNWSIIDPVNQTFTDYRDNGTNPGIAMPSNEGDLFCAGHAWDAHGRLFVAGGEREVSDGDPLLGGRLAYLFDPSQTGGSGASSTQWIRQTTSFNGLMAKYRYYPTVTLAASGSMLVIGGTEDSSQADENNYETFAIPDPPSMQGTWQTFTVGGNPVRLFPGPDSSQISADGFNQYDWVHLLSSGDVFRAGSSARSSRWTHADTSAPSAWLAPGSHTGSSTESFRIYGTAVLFPNLNSSYQDTVMVLGGETEFQ